jgi:hypothetical protein
VAGSKLKPARVVFLARGEMGDRGVEFSSVLRRACGAIRQNQPKAANRITLANRASVPGSESSDTTKPDDRRVKCPDTAKSDKLTLRKGDFRSSAGRQQAVRASPNVSDAVGVGLSEYSSRM